MRVRVCVRVSVYVCAGCLRVLGVCVYVCVCMYKCVCMCVCARACVHMLFARACFCVSLHVRVRVLYPAEPEPLLQVLKLLLI